MMGFGDLAAIQVDTVFPDVQRSFWGSGYIQAAQQQGVIMGFPDGRFYPDAPVTYDQAVTMLMRSLGYGPMAQETGFPTGYLFAAAQANVTTNIQRPASGNAYRRIVANLVYRALDAFIMERVVWGTGDRMFEVTDKRAVTEFLNAIRVEDAWLTRTPLTAGGRDGWVNISVRPVGTAAGNNGTALGEYQINNTNVKDFNRINFLAYVSDSSVPASQRKVYYAGLPADTAALTVDFAQINEVVIAAGAEGAGATPPAHHRVRYAADIGNTRLSNVNVMRDATVVINGKEVTSPHPAGTGAFNMSNIESLAGSYGRVTFVLNGVGNSAWDYDTVIIEEFNAFTVESNNTQNQRLFADIDIGIAQSWNLSYGGTAGRDNRVTVRDLQGNVVDPRDIRAGDVVTYKAASGVFEYVSAVVGGRTIDGTVNRIGATARVYLVGSEILIGEDDLAIGDDGTFIVDSNNYIVEFIPSEDTNTRYGVVESAENNTMILYDVDGQAEIDLTLASQVRVNDVSGKSRSSVVALLTDGMFIAYTVNSNGLVNSINTIDDIFTDSELDDDDAAKATGVINYRAGTGRRTLNGTFNGQMRTANIASTTPVWVEVASGSDTMWVRKDLTQLEDDQFFSNAEMFNWRASSRTAGAIAIPAQATPVAGNAGNVLRNSNWRMVVITEIVTTGNRAQMVNGDRRMTFYGHDGRDEIQMGDAYAVNGFTWSTSGANNPRPSDLNPANPANAMVAILITNDAGEVYHVLNLGRVTGTAFTPTTGTVAQSAWAALIAGNQLATNLALEGITFDGGAALAADINIRDGIVGINATGTPPVPTSTIVTASRYGSIVWDSEDWATGGLRELPATAGMSNRNAGVVAMIDGGEAIQMIISFVK
jgi:hypothetical protein